MRIIVCNLFVCALFGKSVTKELLKILCKSASVGNITQVLGRYAALWKFKAGHFSLERSREKKPGNAIERNVCKNITRNNDGQSVSHGSSEKSKEDERINSA